MIAKFVLVLLALSAAAGPDPFRAIDIDAAVAAAKQEKKVVLVAFGAPSSADTKKLDSTTWGEINVRQWIAKKAVAIRVDVEKRADLAERYRIHILPTIVFLGAQGTELDRMTGYQSGRTFPADADAILAGGDPVARMKKRLVGHENDPNLRIDLAGALLDRGLLKESLDEYLWCWDHGVENDPSFAEVRRTFLVKEIQRLGRIYTEASDAFAARSRGLFEHVTECSAPPDEVLDYVALQKALEREYKILEAYDITPADGPECAEMRTRLAPHVIEALIDATRYEEALQLIGDVFADLAARVAELQKEIARANDELGKDAQPAIDVTTKKFRLNASRRYLSLLAVKRYDDAEKYAQQLIAADTRGSTYVLLIQTAIRIEAHGAAKTIAARAYADAKLSEAEKAEVRTAAAAIVQPK